MGGRSESDAGMVDFFEHAITPACRRALNYLGQHRFIEDFYLAGGTALALQIGHRISTDLDWFSTTRTLLAPEREAVRVALQTSGAGSFVQVGRSEICRPSKLSGCCSAGISLLRGC